jgi:hypothetical protein
MLPNGIGGSSASFGPFNDLAYARYTESTLKRHGLKPWIASEKTAKDDDLHGVNNLKIKFPKGVDAQ